MEALRKPLSHGAWAGLLRDMMVHLHDVAVRKTRMHAGLKTRRCYLLASFHETFERGEIGGRLQGQGHDRRRGALSLAVDVEELAREVRAAKEEIGACIGKAAR